MTTEKPITVRQKKKFKELGISHRGITTLDEATFILREEQKRQGLDNTKRSINLNENAVVVNSDWED